MDAGTVGDNNTTAALAAYLNAVVPPLFACDARLVAAALQRQDARTALAQFAADAGARRLVLSLRAAATNQATGGAAEATAATADAAADSAAAAAPMALAVALEMSAPPPPPGAMAAFVKASAAALDARTPIARQLRAVMLSAAPATAASTADGGGGAGADGDQPQQQQQQGQGGPSQFPAEHLIA